MGEKKSFLCVRRTWCKAREEEMDERGCRNNANIIFQIAARGGGSENLSSERKSVDVDPLLEFEPYVEF